MAKWESFGIYASKENESRIMRGFKGKPFWAKYDFRWVKLRIGKQLQMRKKK